MEKEYKWQKIGTVKYVRVSKSCYKDENEESPLNIINIEDHWYFITFHYTAYSWSNISIGAEVPKDTLEKLGIK